MGPSADAVELSPKTDPSNGRSRDGRRPYILRRAGMGTGDRRNACDAGHCRRPPA
jgi:hypothetical protein